MQELQARVQGVVFSFYGNVCVQSYYIAIIRQVVQTLKVRLSQSSKEGVVSREKAVERLAANHLRACAAL